MIPSFKTKQELVKALSGQVLTLLSDIEVVNSDGIKAVNDKLKIVQQKRKLHVIIFERR